MELTEIKIKELFKASPKPVQQFIMSGQMEEVIIILEEKYDLSEQESRDIQTISLGYILGVLDEDIALKMIGEKLDTRREGEVVEIQSDIETMILTQR